MNRDIFKLYSTINLKATISPFLCIKMTIFNIMKSNMQHILNKNKAGENKKRSSF